MCGKLSDLHFNVSLISNFKEKGPEKYKKNYRTNLSLVILLFKTFSPRLENNDTSTCSYDSFPRMVTYMLCVEKCLNYIPMYYCPSIAGSLS